MNEIRLRLPRPFPWQSKLKQAVESEARFITAVMGRRAGKTTACATIAGLAALDRKEVFWGSPTHDTSGIGRDKFMELFRPVTSRNTVQPPETDVVGGGRVIWRSFEKAGAALGRGIDLAVVDEAARVKRQVIFEDLLPTIGDTGGKILAITTPRGRRSWVFDWYTKAKSGDPLYAVVHGPSTENPSTEVRDFVEIARKNMPDTLFRQEIMGQFIEGEGAVFRRIRENATLDGWLDAPVEGRSYIVGCDLAKHQDWTVLLAMDTTTGEAHGFERFHHLDWPAVEARVAAFSRKWQNAPIWIDATGVGDPVYDRLCASGLPAVPVKFTSDSKSNLIVALMNAMEKSEISYPADDTLIAELEAFAYEELPSGKFRYSAPDGLHDDCVIALSLATFGKARTGQGLEYGWVA